MDDPKKKDEDLDAAAHKVITPDMEAFMKIYLSIPFGGSPKNVDEVWEEAKKFCQYLREAGSAFMLVVAPPGTGRDLPKEGKIFMFTDMKGGGLVDSCYLLLDSSQLLIPFVNACLIRLSNSMNFENPDGPGFHA